MRNPPDDLRVEGDALQSGSPGRRLGTASPSSPLYALDLPVGVFRTHDGQTSVEARNCMKKEQQKAFREAGGRYMGKAEGYLRTRLMRSRILSWLRYVPSVGYPCKIVEWDAARKDGVVRTRYVV